MKERVITMVAGVGMMLGIAGCGDADNLNIAIKSPSNKSEVNITVNKNDVKKVIAAWQTSRWKANEIENARKKNGKVQIDDLKVQCNLPEMQPMADLLVADYIMAVNLLDAYAAAPNEAEAVKMLVSSISMKDVAKMLEDSAKVMLSLKEIKDKAVSNKWKFIKDSALITSMSASMGNGVKILKTLLENQKK